MIGCRNDCKTNVGLAQTDRTRAIRYEVEKIEN
jgi:hypothetical protein